MTEQMPDTAQPAAPWWRRHLLPIALGVVVAVLAVTLAVVLWPSSGPSAPFRFGETPQQVAAKLKTCSNPQGTTTLTCTGPGGDEYVIVTFDSQQEQDYFVAMIKDAGTDGCNVIVPGVAVGANTSAALTGGIGIPERFAADHHGYTIGNCS